MRGVIAHIDIVFKGGRVVEVTGARRELEVLSDTTRAAGECSRTNSLRKREDLYRP